MRYIVTSRKRGEWEVYDTSTTPFRLMVIFGAKARADQYAAREEAAQSMKAMGLDFSKVKAEGTR